MERDINNNNLNTIRFISTHTLTWSVTLVHKLKITVENNFNSHAHVERDALLKFSLCQIIGISTHTLTWSVTICVHNRRGRHLYFNSHAHVERDGATPLAVSATANFNSHAHVERDP